MPCTAPYHRDNRLRVALRPTKYITYYLSQYGVHSTPGLHPEDEFYPERRLFFNPALTSPYGFFEWRMHNNVLEDRAKQAWEEAHAGGDEEPWVFKPLSTAKQRNDATFAQAYPGQKRCRIDAGDYVRWEHPQEKERRLKERDWARPQVLLVAALKEIVRKVLRRRER